MSDHIASQTILVTGGAGYVGSHTAAALIEAGHRVVVLDNLRTGHRAAVPDEALFIEGDLADRAGLDRVFEAQPIDAIMHFAALSLVGESMREPLSYLGDNVENAINLMRAALAHDVGKFVLSSTANLFGDGGSEPIGEDAPVVPGSPYGESKNIIERMLAWLDRTHGLRSACLRYFNAAGADPSGVRGEAHDPETHLIPNVLAVALGQKPALEIFGDDYATQDGTCVRDYVHVLDLASAHILALEALDRGSVRYNLGNGAGYSVKQVIEAARRVSGHAIPMTVGPRRPGDPPVLVASSERIKQELGWRPRYADLETIVETAWNWHRAHPNGYPDPDRT